MATSDTQSKDIHYALKTAEDTIKPVEKTLPMMQELVAENAFKWLHFFSRFANPQEISLNVLGIIASVTAGVAQPGMALLFGRLTTAFTDYERVLRLGGDSETVRVATDRLLRETNQNVTWLVIVGIGLFLTTYVYMGVWEYTGESISRRIRAAYLRSVLRQDITWHDEHGAGEVTGGIETDTHHIQGGISEKVPLAVMYISTFFAGFVIAFTQNWRLALVLAATMVPTIGAAGIVMEMVMSKFKILSMKEIAEASSMAEEVFSGIRAVQAFGSEQKLARLFDTINKRAMEYDLKSTWGTVFGYGTMGFIQYSGYALAFWYGTTLIIRGQATSGQVVAVFLSVLTGSFSLAEAAPKVQAMSLGAAAGQNVFAIIDRVPTIDSASPKGIKPAESRGQLELQGVSFAYASRPNVPVLDNFTAVFPAGKATAICGPSGSGKSTIIGLLERFYDPLGGTVTLDGVDYQSLNIKWTRQQLGYVQQEPVLFFDTVRANIEHGLFGKYIDDTPEQREARVVAAAKKANAHDFIAKLPQGYDTQVGERGRLLSGGQRQRVAIARAIVGDPPILLLDEATSALDSNSEAIVQDALDNATVGRTTVIVAHRLSTIRNADQIIVLKAGKICESATGDAERSAHEKLLSAPQGIYAMMVATQSFSQDAGVKDFDQPRKEISTLPDSTIKEASLSAINTSDSKHGGASPQEYLARPRAKRLLRVLWKIITFKAGLEDLVTWSLILIASGIVGSVLPVFAVVFGGATNGFSYDRVTETHLLRQSGNRNALYAFIAALIFCLFTTLQMAASLRMAKRLARRLRAEIFTAILRHDMAFFDQDDVSAGRLTSDVSSLAQQITGLFGATGATLMQDFFTILVGSIIGLCYAWRLSLVGLACVPLLLTAGIARLWLLESKEEKSKEAHAESAKFACEAASAIRTVASLTREESCDNHYSSQLAASLRRARRTVILGNCLYAISQALSLWVISLIFWYGSKQLAEGAIDTREFFISLMAITFATIEVGVTLAYVPDMSKAKGASMRALDYIENMPSVDFRSKGPFDMQHCKGHIKFENVVFHYPTRPDAPVLRGLSFEVRPGEFAAIVGPSGSAGKSTMIQLLERFYDPLGGYITLDGTDISEIDVASYRSVVALVGQEPALYAGTIRYNIALGYPGPEGRVTDEEVFRACQEANVHDFIMSLPDGYQTEIGAKGVMLSGGQKQRLSIARALLRNPRVLLLDEATSALDSESERIVQAALDAASKGRSTIAVAHRLSTIKNADVIYVMQEGRVVDKGRHVDLFQRRGLYYDLVIQQAIEEL